MGRSKQSKLIRFTDSEGKEHGLTIQEKAFCDAFLKRSGDGFEAIYDAGYKVKNSKSASQMAYALLLKEDVYTYINERLTSFGYNDENIKKHHTFLINQDADLANKAKGLEMYYRIHGKYAAQKIKIEEEFDDYTDDEIEDELAARRTLANKRGQIKSGSKAPATK